MRLVLEVEAARCGRVVGIKGNRARREKGLQNPVSSLAKRRGRGQVSATSPPTLLHRTTHAQVPEDSEVVSVHGDRHLLKLPDHLALQPLLQLFLHGLKTAA